MILESLERIYLGALRIIILIAATVALLATVFGLLSAIPTFLQWSGITPSEVPSGGTLGQFIEEQKITETSAEKDAQAADIEPLVIPDAKAAAKNIRTYIGKRGTIAEKDWAISLQSKAMDMSDQAYAYAADANRLSVQLLKSRGKPLSEERVAALFVWHANRFAAYLETLRLAEAEANASFWIKLGSAGAGFLAFVLIVFIFLFVKIERSLRVVQTTRVEPPEQAQEHA